MNTAGDLEPAVVPEAQRYFMPAETHPHAACWMAWPVRAGLWDGRWDAVQRDYALIARTIARFEPVIMIAPESHVPMARDLCGDSVEVWECPIDDSWTRDAGPTFLINREGGLAVADWSFNAWGRKYRPYNQDAQLRRHIARRIGVPVVPCDLVAEGGAILSDGEGTIFTTESCLLNPNRNPGKTKNQVEEELLGCLGAQKLVWLPGDPTEVETDGHIDCIASVVAPGRLLLEVGSEGCPEHKSVMDENRRVLEGQTDAKGRSFEVLDIPAAPNLDIDDSRYQPAYVNFYIANGAVIMLKHGVAQDEVARKAVAEAFPDREVVQVRVEALPYGGGGIHCVTQEQPAPMSV